MVQLTTAWLKSCLTDDAVRRSGYQTRERYLRKKTHLRLHSRHIDKIDDFSICVKLTVLYLQNNQLSVIENLDHAVNLTHLYLQNNAIRKMENLSNLISLRILYLGSNEICVVEGLEGLRVEELHIEKQRLRPGDELFFDPRCVGALAYSLKVLDVSGDGLRSFDSLRPLHALELLRATDNPIGVGYCGSSGGGCDTSEMGTCDEYEGQCGQASGVGAAVAAVLSSGDWPQLKELDVRRCPGAARKRSRAAIIAASPPTFVMLDERKVSEESRLFLRGMEQTAAAKASSTTMGRAPFVDTLLGLDDIVARLPVAARRAVSQNMLMMSGPIALALNTRRSTASVGQEESRRCQRREEDPSVSQSAGSIFPAWPAPGRGGSSTTSIGHKPLRHRAPAPRPCAPPLRLPVL